jgi:arylsulfatase A-like enzyme
MRYLILLISTLYFFSCTKKVEIQEKKPNVLVILIDNQRYFELSRNYNQIVQTPRIDKRSTQAVNFTEFYAPPFYSPSRTVLLMGRCALRAGIHNTIGGVLSLHKNETILADIFKKEGYNTSLFGKWYLGSSYPYKPKNRGFDEVFVHGGVGISQLGDFYGNDHIDATYIHNSKFAHLKGFSTDILFDQAINYMDKKKAGKDPFFSFISTPTVYFPANRCPEITKRLLDGRVEDSKYLPLYSMTENVDDNLGKILDYLESTGIKENTIVVLAFDQGVHDRGAQEHPSGSFKIEVCLLMKSIMCIA